VSRNGQVLLQARLIWKASNHSLHADLISIVPLHSYAYCNPDMYILCQIPRSKNHTARTQR